MCVYSLISFLENLYFLIYAWQFACTIFLGKDVIARHTTYCWYCWYIANLLSVLIWSKQAFLHEQGFCKVYLFLNDCWHFFKLLEPLHHVNGNCNIFNVLLVMGFIIVYCRYLFLHNNHHLLQNVQQSRGFQNSLYIRQVLTITVNNILGIFKGFVLNIFYNVITLIFHIHFIGTLQSKGCSNSHF